MTNTAAPRPSIDALSVGDTVIDTTIPVSRADLIAYAAASGDQNLIHDLLAHTELEALQASLDLDLTCCGDTIN